MRRHKNSSVASFREMMRQMTDLEHLLDSFNERANCQLCLMDARLDAVEAGIKLLVQELNIAKDQQNSLKNKKGVTAVSQCLA